MVWPFTNWDYITADHQVIRSLGLVVAVLIGFPALIWRTLIADRQTEVSEASHIADVYTKDVEQLGAKDSGESLHMELRLGGLYALERVSSFGIRL